ncbi:unannotated protein [freshwater metagenome]|uniref:Unannotated protein n=1 Tax=freshwater metagenome TaxID=449393 RepID=A0A6J7D4M5_9ZZZZ
MPLHESAIGHQMDPITTSFDERWVMAYAAGVPDERDELFATDAELLVHPLFPVAPEWQLLTANRTLPTGMTVGEARQGIHVGHDLILHRPIRVGETLTISAAITSVGRRTAGATQDTLFVATDATGQAVWQTRFSSLFLGVQLEGAPTSTDIGWPALPDMPVPADGTTAPEPLATRQSFVRPIDAHVYSECARIWNPIHTDVVAARAAGLAAPILHGTATLARAVSIATDLAGVPLGAVRRISGQLGAMVALGSTIEIRLLGFDGSTLHFDVVEQSGRRAISNGVIATNA